VDRKTLGGLSLRKSLGVFIQGDSLCLALVSRSLRSIRLLDTLTLPDFRLKPVLEMRSEIARFLRGSKTTQFRGVVVVPREHVIARQLDLPSQAEANLAKVVEYQLASLVPSESTSVCYDFCVSKPAPQSKSLQVTVFLVMKSWLDETLQLCEGLGLQVDLVLPSSIATANYVLSLSGRFKAGDTALVAHWHQRQCETVGISRKTFHHSHEINISEDEVAFEALQTEIEFFRGRVNLADETVLDVWVLGDVEGIATTPGEKSFKVHRVSLPRDFGIEIGDRNTKIALIQDQFLALAAGVAGLRRRIPIPMNLLPADRRLRKSKWKWVPTFALVGANLLLLLALVGRGFIQARSYSAQLAQEVARLEPEVKKIRSAEGEISDFQRRTNLLTEFKKCNRRVLDALNELSKILPKNTWVFDFNLRNETMEIYGASGAAAVLPQILDNSTYFKETEFIAPILRDGQGNEVYRLRTKMEQAGSPAQSEATGQPTRTKVPEKSQAPPK